MFRVMIGGLSLLALFFAGIIAIKANQAPERVAERAAHQAKQEERAKLQKQTADYETELYLKSPDARKTRARLILGRQFPGWCDWSSAAMVVHLSGDVYARCNGANFAVSPTINIGMRFIDK